jgi:hypothetical protein
LLAAVALAGPRRLLAEPYVWAGAAIAGVLWAPWLVWQARHGWPQLDVSRSVAAGGSTSSQPWWAVVPFQFLLFSPPLAPVWIAGLVTFLRDRALRDVRFLALAAIVLALVFMATGGKPYYLSGLLPGLIAAGAVQVDGWLERGRAGVRRWLLIAAVVCSAAVSAVIALPLLGVRDAGPVVAVNPDVGETIGWPQFARTVAHVVAGLPDARHAVILTANYGEAGALDRFGPALGLPRVYSGHNAYGDWGPPPDGATPVVTIGLQAPQLAAELRGCHTAARIDDRVDIDNDEQGAVVSVCAAPRRPWSDEWPSLRRLG